MKRLLFVFLFIISLATDAFQMKKESYINIPTANLTPGLFLNVNSSYPIRNVNDVKFDPNIGMDLSYKRFGIALKWYDGLDFALDFSYRILTESGNSPGLAIGISELSGSKYVSPAGSENVFSDEDYADRPPEIASAYFVGTKKISENFEMTMGIGRGRFVGYGPGSKYLNTDAFFDERHGNWAIGIFGGMKVTFASNFAFIAEVNGRDANLGIEYQNEILKGMLALNKFEHLINESDLSSRVSLSVSYKIMHIQEEAQKEKKEFQVTIKLIDKENREPVKGYTVITDSKGDTVKSSESENTHSFTLEPGVYTTFVSADGYKNREFTVTVKGGKVNRKNDKKLYAIELIKTKEPEKPVEAKDSIKKADDFEDIKKEVEEIRIIYPFMRTYLTLAARTMLRRIFNLMNDNEDARLLIIGHSCSEGTYESSRRLSEMRAENVKKYLVERGVLASKISTEGRGETEPIAGKSTEEGRTENRRTEFILYRVKK